jgi:hypothetical protein
MISYQNNTVTIKLHYIIEFDEIRVKECTIGMLENMLNYLLFSLY